MGVSDPKLFWGVGGSSAWPKTTMKAILGNLLFSYFMFYRTTIYFNFP